MEKIKRCRPHRPNKTSAVDWALQLKHLSILWGYYGARSQGQTEDVSQATSASREPCQFPSGATGGNARNLSALHPASCRAIRLAGCAHAFWVLSDGKGRTTLYPLWRAASHAGGLQRTGPVGGNGQPDLDLMRVFRNGNEKLMCLWSCSSCSCCVSIPRSMIHDHDHLVVVGGVATLLLFVVCCLLFFICFLPLLVLFVFKVFRPWQLCPHARFKFYMTLVLLWTRVYVLTILFILRVLLAFAYRLHLWRVLLPRVHLNYINYQETLR